MESILSPKPQQTASCSCKRWLWWFCSIQRQPYLASRKSDMVKQHTISCNSSPETAGVGCFFGGLGKAYPCYCSYFSRSSLSMVIYPWWNDVDWTKRIYTVKVDHRHKSEVSDLLVWGIGMFVGCQSQSVFLMLFWMLKCSPFASCDGSLETETSPETLKQS